MPYSPRPSYLRTLYLRTPFTVFLSVLWFMGAIPAPAAQHILPRLVKKAIQATIHIGKQVAVKHTLGPAAALITGKPIALLPAAVRGLRK